MDYDAKCPACGKEFTVTEKIGSAICPGCGKETEIPRAIKYYTSFSENSSVTKEAHGDDYRKVNLLLDGINDLLADKKFLNAEEKITEGLSLTDCDYRLYMAMVAAKTKNYTDLTDKTHKEFLNKAIEVADADQKKEIKKIYKDYYDKTKLTAEELAAVNTGEAGAVKAKLERGLKSLIPEYMAKEKKAKILLAVFPVLVVLGIAAAIPFIIMEKAVISLAGIATATVGFLLMRFWFGLKDETKCFNAFLDLYDFLDGRTIPETHAVAVYQGFYKIYLKFADKDPVVSISYETVNYLSVLFSVGDEELDGFLKNDKYFAENIPAQNEDE